MNKWNNYEFETEDAMKIYSTSVATQGTMHKVPLHVTKIITTTFELEIGIQ